MITDLQEIKNFDSDLVKLNTGIDEQKIIINDAKERVANLKKEIQTTAFTAMLEAMKKHPDKILAITWHFYWCASEITTTTIYNALSMVLSQDKAKQSMAMAKDLASMDIRCSECSKVWTVKVTSRNDYQTKLNSQRYITCDECKEKQHKAYEIQRATIQNRLYQLKTMPYQEYLQTDEWKETRLKALKRADFKCQVCNRPDKLNVHHRTYENRGNEQNRDLTVLCEDCHKLYHFGKD